MTDLIEQARNHPQVVEIWLAWCAAGDTEFTRGDGAGRQTCNAVRVIAEALDFPVEMLGTGAMKVLMHSEEMLPKWRDDINTQ